MELKKAVADLRETVRSWRWNARNGDKGRYIYYDRAIPVAETLLVALEDVDKPAHTTCRYCGEEFDRECPLCRTAPGTGKPPAHPPTLAGRTVDGEGWKAFEMHDGQLHSEMFGRGQIGETSLPENEWLNYRDWQMSTSLGDYAFHILKDKEVAEKWIHRGGTELSPVVRRVGWRKLREEQPTYVPRLFFGHIFTAEEIYILPEEGEMDLSLWSKTDRPPSDRRFPEPPPAKEPSSVRSCGHMVRDNAVFCPLCIAECHSPERPPEKGDWVVFTTWPVPKPFKITSIDEKIGGRHYGLSDGGWTQCPEHMRIVRRAADPLRVRDKVAFGSIGTSEGWIYAISDRGEFTSLHINLEANRTPLLCGDVAHLRAEGVTLVEPVYDRPAEKSKDWVVGQCRKCGRDVSTSEIGGDRPAKQDWLCPDCAQGQSPKGDC